MKKENILKYFTIFIGWIEMICFSGIIFGINSLFSVLKKEMLFSEFCKNNNKNITIIINEKCVEQNKMFGFILITAVSSQCLIAFPIGIFFDKFGQKWSKFVAGICFLIGCCFFYIFSKSSLFIYPFASFLSVTTQCLLNCNLCLGSLFPKYQNFIVSIMSGSLDSSSVIFTFISLSYFYGVNLFTSIISLGICGFLIMMFSSFFLLGKIDRKNSLIKHKEDISIQISIQNVENKDLILNDEKNLEKEDDEDMKNNKNNVKIYSKKLEESMAERYPTLLRALFSRQYLLQLTFFTIIFFRFSFSLAQLSLQMEQNFPSQDSLINNLLYVSSYFFFCGVLVSPFAGFIVDKFKGKLIEKCNESMSGSKVYSSTLKCFILPLLICSGSNLLLSIFIMVPRVWAVYLTYSLITVTRSFLFSLNSSYLLQGFPRKYFGQLCGIAILFSGVVSFTQYGLLFKDSEHMKIINFILIFTSCVTFVHPLLLCCGKCGQKNKTLKEFVST